MSKASTPSPQKTNDGTSATKSGSFMSSKNNQIAASLERVMQQQLSNAPRPPPVTNNQKPSSTTTTTPAPDSTTGSGARVRTLTAKPVQKPLSQSMGEDQLTNHLKNLREGLKPVNSSTSPTKSSEPKKEPPPTPPRRVVPGLSTNLKSRSLSTTSTTPKPMITEKSLSNSGGITEIHATEDLKVEESRSRTNSTVSDDGESSVVSSSSGSRRDSVVSADDDDEMSPSPSPVSSPMDTIRSLSDVMEPSKEVVYQTLRKRAQHDDVPKLERAHSQDKDLNIMAQVILPNVPVTETPKEPEPEPQPEPEPEPAHAEPEPTQPEPASEQTQSEQAQQKKYEYCELLAYCSQRVIVDVASSVMLYSLDVAKSSWNLLEKESCNLTIFHEPQSSSEIPKFRMLAVSKSSQYVINSWLEGSSYTKMSETFYHIRIRLGNLFQDYGVQFRSADDALKYLTVMDTCLAKNRERSTSSGGSANAPSSTTPTSSPIKLSGGSNTWNAVRPTQVKRSSISSSSSMILGKDSVSKSGPLLTGQSVGSLKMIASSFEQQAMRFIQGAHEFVFSQEFSESLARKLSRQDIWDSLQVVMYIVSGEHFGEYLKKEVPQLVEFLNIPPPLYGTAVDTVIEAAKSGDRSRKSVEANLILKLGNESQRVQSLACQLSALIHFIANFDVTMKVKEKEKDNHVGFNQLALQLTTTARNFINAMDTLLNDVETLKYIKFQLPPEVENQTNTSEKALSDSIICTNLSIWDDKDSVGVENVELAGATLNQLVAKITAQSHADSSITQSFLTTYQAFCTPATLFKKLVERYKIPDRIFWEDERKATAIQLRTMITMKQLFDSQMANFDQDLINDIIAFLEKEIAYRDGTPHPMLFELKKIVNNKIAQRKETNDVMWSTDALAQISRFMPPGGTSPLNLFLETDALIIAQHLCLLDFAIYQKIQVSELMNQSWNKAKLKHRSPNVLALIARSTRLSLWVASVVLFCNHLSQRSKVLEKMVDITIHLRQLNNFNSLMSVVAGLSTSAIHRLKRAFGKIPSDKRKSLEKNLKLMSPDGSYKTYRGALSEAILPCLPYMGVSLTDLTFIEEGNSDLYQGKINFKKHEMLYKAIHDLLQYQPTPYPFQVHQPLYTFLMELPHILSDDQLYNLSIFLEPREKKDKK